MRPLPTMPLQVFLATLLAGLFLTFGYTETALNNRASAVHLEQSTGQSLQRLAFEMNDKLDRGMFERARDIQGRGAQARDFSHGLAPPARRSAKPKPPVM